VQRLRFDRVGVFTYSDEDGTAAFSMPERVPDTEKRRRRGRLMAPRATSRSPLTSEWSDKITSLDRRAARRWSAWFAGRSYRDAPEVDGLVLVKAEHSVLEKSCACGLSARWPTTCSVFPLPLGEG